MKILFYNWVPFDDITRRGGGVTVYLNDFIQKISLDPLYQCTFLSSGLEYDFRKKLRIEATDNCLSDRVKTFQIVNSPVHAPAYVQFSNLDTYLNDTTLLDLLETFWTEQGGFDVVHFHNLEGLSLSVLKLKELHPEAKFYFSLHNYFLFSPQVNLWTDSEKNCYCDPQFPCCSQCLTTPDSKIESLAASTKTLLNRFGNVQDTWLYKGLKRVAFWIRYFSARKIAAKQSICSTANDPNSVYAKYRTQNVAAANQCFDGIFAVSRQVAAIAQFYGIHKDKLIVDYIGTEAASKQHPPKKITGEFLSVGFLGYARADKGFDAFIAALESLPQQATLRMDILLAAKCNTRELFDKYQSQLESMMGRFHSFRFMNGYSKSEQTQLLEQIDLGVVPVLWEDNLPQVAIEYIASGIPIVVSDRGGAKELCTNADFIYESNDIHALSKKLEEFAQHPERLNSFWNDMPKLTTMEAHIQNMKRYYHN